MKSRILEGRGRLAGHEYWRVGARTRVRILRGMAASFVREVGHGFGCDGARKVNERVVLEVLVARGEMVGLRVAGVRGSDFGWVGARKVRSWACAPWRGVFSGGRDGGFECAVAGDCCASAQADLDECSALTNLVLSNLARPSPPWAMTTSWFHRKRGRATGASRFIHHLVARTFQ